jgi:integrase
MLALNAGMRDAEIRGLQWGRKDLFKACLTVGDGKTEAGEGRTIPVNSDLLEAMVDYSKWYTKRFHTIKAEWYVFPARILFHQLRSSAVAPPASSARLPVAGAPGTGRGLRGYGFTNSRGGPEMKTDRIPSCRVVIQVLPGWPRRGRSAISDNSEMGRFLFGVFGVRVYRRLFGVFGVRAYMRPLDFV